MQFSNTNREKNPPIHFPPHPSKEGDLGNWGVKGSWFEEFILLLSIGLCYWIFKVSKGFTPIVLLHLSWTNVIWNFACDIVLVTRLELNSTFISWSPFYWILLELCISCTLRKLPKKCTLLLLSVFRSWFFLYKELVPCKESQPNYRYVSEELIKSEINMKEFFLTKQTTIWNLCNFYSSSFFYYV